MKCPTLNGTFANRNDFILRIILLLFTLRYLITPTDEVMIGVDITAIVVCGN